MCLSLGFLSFVDALDFFHLSMPVEALVWLRLNSKRAKFHTFSDVQKRLKYIFSVIYHGHRSGGVRARADQARRI